MERHPDIDKRDLYSEPETDEGPEVVRTYDLAEPILDLVQSSGIEVLDLIWNTGVSEILHGDRNALEEEYFVFQEKPLEAQAG